MATFVVLMNFTEQGIKSVKQSPDRAEAFTAVATKMGVTIKSILWTVGHYDLVTTVEGSDEAVTTLLLTLGMAGNVRTETLRAYTAGEMKAIIGKLG
ncbi:GYD domain-containing protein [Rivibacter subsaxonicus]|uniref:Uncharacterized protein with GYD domain n=1 Tax=Rivibacter subsaxonicus TaxID=457575 RepID=A0A4Q7VWN2_9BURK|nr:GYD domain-containing protein [Rivibacter subsaxonicus]RZU00719.1 uncharacterized protein with GYD domain [Rivibacter subsaxonicus]